MGFAHALAGGTARPSDQPIFARAGLHRVGLHGFEHRQADDWRAIFDTGNDPGYWADVAIEALYDFPGRQSPPAAIDLGVDRLRPWLDRCLGAFQRPAGICSLAAYRAMGGETYHMAARGSCAQVEADDSAFELGRSVLRQGMRQFDSGKDRRESQRGRGLRPRRPYGRDLRADETISGPVLEHVVREACPARCRIGTKDRTQHRLDAAGLEWHPGPSSPAHIDVQRGEVAAQVVVDRDDHESGVVWRHHRDSSIESGGAERPRCLGRRSFIGHARDGNRPGREVSFGIGRR